VRSARVVVDTPSLNLGARILDKNQCVLRAFITDGAIEGFYIAIVNRLARPDLPLNFHHAPIRASAVDKPFGAVSNRRDGRLR
jgi:hypothetical protein